MEVSVNKTEEPLNILMLTDAEFLELKQIFNSFYHVHKAVTGDLPDSIGMQISRKFDKPVQSSILSDIVKHYNEETYAG
jgi:hypothetical protein